MHAECSARRPVLAAELLSELLQPVVWSERSIARAVDQVYSFKAGADTGAIRASRIGKLMTAAAAAKDSVIISGCGTQTWQVSGGLRTNAQAVHWRSIVRRSVTI
jgi:hypothetical protein